MNASVLMKNIMLLITIFGIALLNAQESEKEKLTIEKGTWNLGGNFAFGFSQSKAESSFGIGKSDNTAISVFPNFGYAVGENVIVGVGLGYGYSKVESSSETEGNIENSSSDSKEFTVAPYIRAYFGIGERLAIFVQGEAGFSMAKNSTSNPNNNLRINEEGFDEYSIGLRPGLTYFVSEKFAMETRLGFFGYSKRDTEIKSLDSGFNQTRASSEFDFSLDTSNLLFGLSYYF